MSARTFTTELWQEFRTPQRMRPRAVDETETVLSVLLAILLAHLLHATNVGWAAFSGYIVMRSHLATTVTRGGLRIIGTALGALSAWGVALLLGHEIPLLSLTLGLVGGFTLYCALTRRRSYAWLLTGLTFSMVILDGLTHPLVQVTHYAQTRMLETLAGTLACLAISLLSSFTLRPWVLGDEVAPESKPIDPVNWSRDAALHALQAAIALAAVPWLAHWCGDKELTQAAITIMALMMVPLASLSANQQLVSVRVVHRFVGCMAGAILATLATLLCQGVLWATLLCLVAGVVIGRHIENSGGRLAYVGNQFSLLFLVVFVPDSYQELSAEPGYSRLQGVVIGIVLLQVVRLIFAGARRFSPSAAPT